MAWLTLNNLMSRCLQNPFSYIITITWLFLNTRNVNQLCSCCFEHWGWGGGGGTTIELNLNVQPGTMKLGANTSVQWLIIPLQDHSNKWPRMFLPCPNCHLHLGWQFNFYCECKISKVGMPCYCCLVFMNWNKQFYSQWRISPSGSPSFFLSFCFLLSPENVIRCYKFTMQ